MSFYLISFFIFFHIRFTEEIMAPPKVKNSSPVTTCLITMGVSLAKTKLSILYSSEYEDLTTDIIKSVKVPVLINASEKPEFEKTKIRFMNDLVMIFGQYNINRVLNDTFWNFDTRFFLLHQKEEELEQEFFNFWGYRIFNVYGALEKGQKVLFFGYTPYVNNCGMGKPTIVDECYNGEFAKKGVRFQKTQNVLNLNGCEINISVANINPNIIFRKKCGVETESRILGFEGNMIQELSERMNFTTVFNCNVKGVGWLKPTPGGAVGDVYTGKSEFAMGVLGPSLERLYYLDLSIPYNMDECLSFGVPKGFGVQNATVFNFFTYEFDKYGWILVITMFFTFVSFFIFSNMIINEKWVSRKNDVILELYGAFMGMPVLIPKSSSQRLSILCWIFFSLIVTVAYKSTMGSKLTIPSKDPDIKTFEELIQSNLKFTGPKAMYLFLIRSPEKDPTLVKIINRFTVTDFETAEAVHLIAKEKKIAYLRHKSTFLYNAIINADAIGHVHVIDACIVSFHPVVATRKNSFFTSKLNETITRLEESGIMAHWRAKFIYEMPRLSQPFSKLRLDRFWGLFWLMVFGYATSLMCFGFEIWSGFRYKREKKKLFRHTHL